jgi:protein SCO1/2
LPDDSWKFLTSGGDGAAKVADAVGFRYTRDTHGFIHPVVVIFIAPGGKITRYLYVQKYQYGVQYPVTFSPVDIAAAIDDARKGTPWTSIQKTLLLCFPHEPGKQRLFFNILSTVGAATLIGMIALFIYLRKSSRRKNDERPSA